MPYSIMEKIVNGGTGGNGRKENCKQVELVEASGSIVQRDDDAFSQD
jgi:hypothetical protein